MHDPSMARCAFRLTVILAAVLLLSGGTTDAAPFHKIAADSWCGALPTEPSVPTTDTIWIEDAVPDEAINPASWQVDPTVSISGSASFTTPPGGGIHGLDSAGRLLFPPETFVAYVLLGNPCAPAPLGIGIVLAIETNPEFPSSWTSEVRSYYLGQNIVGADGISMGPLPAPGQWTRLEITDLPIGSAVTELSLRASGAPVWWDHIGAGSGVLGDAAALTVTPSTVTIADGASASLTATVHYYDGTSANVTGSATWSTDDASVATVVAGVVTGVDPGTTRITVESNFLRLRTTVVVNPVAPVLTSLTVAPATVALATGQTAQLTATATYSNGTTADVTATAAWTSSDSTVATVSAGAVTGVVDGTATITATLSGHSAGATIHVGNVPTSLSVAPAAAELEEGAATSLTAILHYANGSEADVTGDAVWTTSDPGVATSDGVSPGLIQGVAPGTATISATHSGFTGTSVITVRPRVDGLSVLPDGSLLRVGETLQLHAELTHSDDSTVDVTSSATWTSGAPAMASVDAAGIVTAHAPGTALISAEAAEGGFARTVAITVLSPLQSLSVTPQLGHLTVGSDRTLAVLGSYAGDLQIDVRARATWSTSNSAVATVNSGIVTALAVGTVTITAIVDGVSASATIVTEAANPNPPDPATIAPAIDQTKITTVYDSTRFLYEGSPRVQTGVDPGAIERHRAAVLYGRVLLRGGVPLPGVRARVGECTVWADLYARRRALRPRCERRCVAHGHLRQEWAPSRASARARPSVGHVETPLRRGHGSRRPQRHDDRL